MNDYELRELRNGLINLLNGANIPMEVKRLVLFEVYNSVTNKADEVILQQQMEQLNKKNEEVLKEAENGGLLAKDLQQDQLA